MRSSIAVALTLLAVPAAPLEPPAAAPLAFERLYSPEPTGAGEHARIAPETLSLGGRKVRMVGHMVRMELPPRAAFYLAARPVEADESGGGTADLPPSVVRVEVPWIAGEVPWIDGPLEVIGRLELGRAEDDEGRVSWIRIVMEAPGGAPP
jgi:hypothetical protein